jgi:RNA polymerase sigma-70 factor, ECF subfamily
VTGDKARKHRVAGELSDGAIVRAVLGGDVDQYAVLVRRYQDRYARFATRMLGSVDAAEDAVQEAFIRAYEQLAQCREPENFAGWFFIILRNRCLAAERQAKATVDLDSVLAEPPVGERADRRAEAAGEWDALERALRHLTPEQREVFVLRHVEDWSYEEMAQRTGISVAALKMRMHRSYERLRELLGHLWDGS